MSTIPKALDVLARAAHVRAAHGPTPPARDPVAHERLTRGWPNLVELGGAPPRDAIKAARKQLTAIDPIQGPVWARDVAVRWLNAFTINFANQGADLAAADAALGNRAPPDASTLHEFFRHGLQRTFGYAFAHADAVFVFEALLGADVVATAFAKVIAHAPEDAWVWPNAERPNPNVRSIAHATAVGWVLLRAERATQVSVLAALRSARSRALGGGGGPPPGTLARAIDFLLGDALPDLAHEAERRLRIVHLSEHLAAARARHPWRLWLADPQDFWITNTSMPSHALAKLAAEPRWFAGHLVDRWSELAIPFTRALADARGNLPKKLTKKGLDAEVASLFDALVEEIRRVRGDAGEESVRFERAAHDLVVLRARSDDPLPEAHVAQILATDGWTSKILAPARRLGASAEEIDRWLAAANRGCE